MRRTRFLLPALWLAASRLCAVTTGCQSGFPVAITPTSAFAASLFWQPPSGILADGPTNYSVYRGTSPSTLAQVAVTRTPFFVDSSLIPAATYYYEIFASNHGLSANGASCVTTPPVPFAPTILSAVALSATHVVIAWEESLTAGSLAIKLFRLYRGTSPTSLVEVAGVQKLAHIDTVSPATSYYYALQAVDVQGNGSPLSPTMLVTTPNQ